jgi:hypothetical protein
MGCEKTIQLEHDRKLYVQRNTSLLDSNLDSSSRTSDRANYKKRSGYFLTHTFLRILAR